MNFCGFRVWGLCALLLMTAGVPTNATLVVDDLSVALPAPLTTGFFDTTVPFGELTDSATSTLTHADRLFDAREVTLTQSSGSAATNNGLFFTINASQGFNISSNGAAGTIELTYSMADGSTIDFLTNDIKEITLNSFDLPFGEPLIIDIDIEDNTGATGSVSQSITSAVTSSLPINFPLGTLSSLDFSEVKILTITFNLPDAGDLNFGDITLIPEPGSIALAGLASGLLLASRRRFRA